MSKTILRVNALFVALVCMTSIGAQAAAVSPASGLLLSGTEAFPQSNIDFVIDGVIDVDQWLAVDRDTPEFGVARFDFGGAVYDLSAINVWNNGGNIENDGEGVSTFSLEFFDSGSNSIGASGPIALTDILALQAKAFDSVSDVAAVEMTISDSHGARYAIFHEVSFEMSPVPVPAAAWLFISALGGLLAAGCKQIKA